jgi:flagellar hook-associated protein 2
MGTTSTSPTGGSVTANSAASASNPNASPLYFTGLSTYSSDFQTIIQRAVQVADIPVQSLENQESTVQAQEQALSALEPAVTAVGNDVANLGTLASTQGLAASSSDPSVVAVQNTGATVPGTYTISNIQSLAAAASETSLSGYTSSQSINASGLVILVSGSNTYQLNLTASGENNISGLAQAINNANAGVTATVLTAGSSNYLVVSANNSGATTLQLNSVTPTDLVTNTGSGTETSLQTYADAESTPVSQNGQVQLVVGSQSYTLNVSGSANTLDGLAQAINSADAGVTASVEGSVGTYALAITAQNGPTTIQVNDLQDGTDLISDTNQGSNAKFQINGISTPIVESTNNISDVIPGVSFTLLNTTSGSQSVTLSLAPSSSQLGSALKSFVNDYNTLVGDVTAQEGQNAGPLGGNLIINQISEAMQDLVMYFNPTSSSSVHSLSDLGVTFNDTGQMSFSSNTFNSLSETQISDAYKFLGSSNSGFAALASNFTQLSDPVTGTIEAQINGYQSEISSLQGQITNAEAYVNQVQQTATQQMEAADALVAELQQQQTDLDASIESVNYVLYGRQVSVDGI